MSNKKCTDDPTNQKDRKRDEELEGATITIPEMARILGLTRGRVYGILKNSKYSHFFETIVIPEKKNPDSKIHDETASQTVDVPDDIDAELLTKVLVNPEINALLASLAKAMK